jgi:hypothetical protein
VRLVLTRLRAPRLQVDVKYARGSALEFTLTHTSSSKDCIRLRAESAVCASVWTRLLKRVSQSRTVDEIDGSVVVIRMYGRVWLQDPSQPTKWTQYHCLATPNKMLVLLSTTTGKMVATLPIHHVDVAIEIADQPALSAPTGWCFSVSSTVKCWDGMSHGGQSSVGRRTWVLCVNDETELRKWGGLGSFWTNLHQVDLRHVTLQSSFLGLSFVQHGDSTVVAQMDRSGAAFMDGRVLVGDSLLSVNGRVCLGKSTDECSRAVKTAVRPLRLVFQSSLSGRNCVVVELRSLEPGAAIAALGIELGIVRGRRSSLTNKKAQCVQITGVGGAAAGSIIEVGDQLVSVNGVYTIEHTIAECHRIIAAAEQPYLLVVRKPDIAVMPVQQAAVLSIAIARLQARVRRRCAEKKAATTKLQKLGRGKLGVNKVARQRIKVSFESAMGDLSPSRQLGVAMVILRIQVKFRRRKAARAAAVTERADQITKVQALTRRKQSAAVVEDAKLDRAIVLRIVGHVVKLQARVRLMLAKRRVGQHRELQLQLQQQQQGQNPEFVDNNGGAAGTGTRRVVGGVSSSSSSSRLVSSWDGTEERRLSVSEMGVRIAV